jgi:isocitrate/isopropylmalate dehydrogenase
LRFLLEESRNVWLNLIIRKSFSPFKTYFIIKENFDDVKVKENLEKVYRSLQRQNEILVSKKQDAMMKSNIQVLK